MVNLELKGEIKEDVNISLQNPYYKEATISTIGYRFDDYFKHGISFKSANQTETQYYLYHQSSTRRV
jgi:hypothetical protein